MTTHRGKRCKHCQRFYYYQGSGDGCFDNLNDERYCPECMKDILKVLNKIPLHSKKTWVVTNELSKEEFFEAREKRFKAESENGFFLRPIRIGVGRSITKGSGLDMEIIDSESIDYEKIDGKTYCFSSWKNGHKPDIMYVAKEEIIKTREIIGYWYE